MWSFGELPQALRPPPYESLLACFVVRPAVVELLASRTGQHKLAVVADLLARHGETGFTAPRLHRIRQAFPPLVCRRVQVQIRLLLGSRLTVSAVRDDVDWDWVALLVNPQW